MKPFPKPGEDLRAQIHKSRFGYYAHITDGPSIVGEVPAFAFTRRGIERKLARFARRRRCEMQRDEWVMHL